jgi:hypothetical protein
MKTGKTGDRRDVFYFSTMEISECPVCPQFSSFTPSFISPVLVFERARRFSVAQRGRGFCPTSSNAYDCEPAWLGPLHEMFSRIRSLPGAPMAETFEAYRARVLSYLGDEDLGWAPNSSRNEYPSTARCPATSTILTAILSRSDRAPISRTANARPSPTHSLSAETLVRLGKLNIRRRSAREGARGAEG